MILAMFVGFFQIRQLEFMKDEGKKSTDKIIIITAFGMFAYSTYTIIAGSLNNRNIQEPRELIVVNGIVELIQVRKSSKNDSYRIDFLSFFTTISFLSGGGEEVWFRVYLRTFVLIFCWP